MQTVFYFILGYSLGGISIIGVVALLSWWVDNNQMDSYQSDPIGTMAEFEADLRNDIKAREARRQELFDR